MIAPKFDANTGEPGPRTHSNQPAPGRITQASGTWPPKNQPQIAAHTPKIPKTKKDRGKWERVGADELFDRMRDQIRGER